MDIVHKLNGRGGPQPARGPAGGLSRYDELGRDVNGGLRGGGCDVMWECHPVRIGQLMRRHGRAGVRNLGHQDVQFEGIESRLSGQCGHGQV